MLMSLKMKAQYNSKAKSDRLIAFLLMTKIKNGVSPPYDDQRDNVPLDPQQSKERKKTKMKDERTSYRRCITRTFRRAHDERVAVQSRPRGEPLGSPAEPKQVGRASVNEIDCSLVAGRAVATSLSIGLYLCNISSPHPHSLVNNITTVVNLGMESACEGFL